MNESFDPRPSDAPSELAIDAYVTDEAEPDEVAAIEAWMAADPANRAVIEARRSGFDAFAEARPQVMLARIRQGVEAAEAEARAEARSAERAASSGWSLPRWLFAGFGLAAAAAAAFVLFVDRGPAPNPGIEPATDVVLTKGALGLRIFRARDGKVDELTSPAPAQAGDRLRFRLDVPEDEGHLMVVGVEATGALFAYHGPRGASVPTKGATDDDGALPGSAVLDDSKGREQVVLVWCPTPFDQNALKLDGAVLATPEGCRQRAFVLDKQ